jgi:4-amino-4-deoxy-L-arabinose transferase-like glycosyltransferase
MAKYSIRENPVIWITLIALANVAVHLFFYNTLGFFRDELLYFSLGRHLSAGYASVPPFTGFMAWVMIHLVGSTLFAARLFPALLSGVMVFLVSGIAKELKGGVYARILAAFGILVFPVNLRGFYMFQPVPFDIFFWTLVFYFAILWINSKKDIFLILLGIVSGIGIMNKYLVLLQLLCLGMVFMFSSYRKIFLQRSFLVAIVLALIIISPNVIWQISNHLPVTTHMQALHNSQLVHVDRFAFLTDQLMMMFAAAFLILPGIVFLLFNEKMRPYRLLAIACLAIVAALVILRGKSYYTGGIYPFLIAAGAVFWENASRSWIPRIMLVAMMIIPTFMVLPATIPIYKAKALADGFAWEKKNIGMGAFLRDEKGIYRSLPQDYADMLGWDELAMIAGKAYGQVPDKPSCMLYCENYGQAGAITVLGKQYGLPDPVCFSESFYYWFPRNLPVEIRSVIYINDTLGEDISHLFSDIRLIGSITDPLAREYGTSVWLATKPVSSFNAFWKQRLQQVTSPF